MFKKHFKNFKDRKRYRTNLKFLILKIGGKKDVFKQSI